MARLYKIGPRHIIVGSRTITGVTWDCGGLITDSAGGSDLWPTTWSDDLYTAWGDGNGFDDAVRFGYAFARLDGDPDTTVTGVDLGQFSAGGDGGKIATMLSLGGVLYCGFNTQDGTPPTWALRKSTDNGVTISGNLVTFPKGGDNLRGPIGFFNAGQDYGDAPDGFVYATGLVWNDPTAVYLIRVPVGEIETLGSWEVYTSTDPLMPTWSTDFTQKQPIYEDGTATANNHNAVGIYLKALGLYVMTTQVTNDVGDFVIAQAPKPWGPWSVIAQYDDWGVCNFTGSGDPLSKHIVPKWIRQPVGDTLEFWMTFSSAGVWDRFNLIKGTFTFT